LNQSAIFLKGKRFYETLRIFSPTICKQCFTGENCKVGARAEKTNKRKSKININQNTSSDK